MYSFAYRNEGDVGVNLVAIGFIVASEGEESIAAQANKRGPNSKDQRSFGFEQMLASAVVNESVFLQVEKNETKEHAETNAALRQQ